MREAPSPVDERLVAPETRYEIIDVAPADYAHVVGDFVAVGKLLTRTSEVNDFAPDASVFRRERNPKPEPAIWRSWRSRSSPPSG